MARLKELMTSLDAGDATELLPSQLQDLGVFDAQGAKPRTALNEDLDFLIKKGTSGRIQCPVYFLLNNVDSETAKKLQALFDETQIPATQISRLLVKNGFSIGLNAIQRHRRRLRDAGCRCLK